MTEQGLLKLGSHEGYRKMPYICSNGYLSIGYGLNIEAEDNLKRISKSTLVRWMKYGMDKKEAAEQLVYEVEEVENVLQRIDWFKSLDPIRQDCIINMCYQMGTDTVKIFKKFVKYTKLGDFEKAVAEMLYRDGSNPSKGWSKWHKETKNRCEDLAQIYRRGSY